MGTRFPFRVVIVGTGTDVGKTHVTACLLAAARGRGIRALGYKPIATGVLDRCDDAEVHAAAAGASYVSPAFAYRRGVSAHLAAREEARPVDLVVIAQRADALAKDADIVVVETAGGLFSPLSDATTNVHLALALSPALVVLVAADRLGVLHDVTACKLAARASRVAISAVVLSTPRALDASSGHNEGELDRLGWGPVVSVFPRANYDHPESLEAGERLLDVLSESTVPDSHGVASTKP